MADVVKTLRIKKAGTPGNVPPPESVPEAETAAEGQVAAPAAGHVTLPRYAQVQAGPATVVKNSKPWTAWAIIATVAVLAMLTLIIFQLVELNFYADNPSAWTHAGMF